MDYKGDLSEAEYVKNFNWFETWFYRNIIEIVENISIFIFLFILLLVLNFYQNKNSKIEVKKYFWYLLIPIFLGFLIWFLKAPVVRYGVFYLNSLIFLFFYFYSTKN